MLHARYATPIFIRIQRDFISTFRSYINMEGRNYSSRQRSINLLPALLLQASRYTIIYKDALEECQVFDIPFKDYIKDRKAYLKIICDYLKIEEKNVDNLNIDRFKVNSSFLNREQKEISQVIIYLIPPLLFFLNSFPTIPRLIWRVYFKLKSKPSPIFKRLIKYRFYKTDLVNELKRSQSEGLLEELKKTRNGC